MWRGLGCLAHVARDRSGRRLAAAGHNGAVVWEVSPVRRVEIAYWHIPVR